MIAGRGLDDFVVEREGIAHDDESHGTAFGGDAFDEALFGGDGERERADAGGVGIFVDDAVADVGGFGGFVAGGREHVELGCVRATGSGGGGTAKRARQNQFDAQAFVRREQGLGHGMFGVQLRGEQVAVGEFVLVIEHDVVGHADAPLREQFFQAGLFAAGINHVADERKQASALFQKAGNFFQFLVGDRQTRAGDDEQLAVGGHVVAAEEREFFPRRVGFFGQNGGELRVAVRVLGFFRIVFAVAGEEAHFELARVG